MKLLSQNSTDLYQVELNNRVQNQPGTTKIHFLSVPNNIYRMYFIIKIPKSLFAQIRILVLFSLFLQLELMNEG